MPVIPNLMLPGNPRVQPDSLKLWFGYDNLYRTMGEVEIAVLQVNGDIGVIPADEIALLTSDVIEQILSIPTTEVFKVEREITHHDVRAWVRKAQEILHRLLGKWAHLPLTSYDALDTGRIMQFVQSYQQVLKPAIREVIGIFIELIERHMGTLQVGRTHGVHALPITVDFWLATILNRILFNAKKMDEFAGQLFGKISGAVGANNAQVALKFMARSGEKTYEERVLEKLGLRPAEISTQILQPEALAYYLFSCTMMTAAFGQFGRDCRQLMRTEIGEIQEPFTAGQVDSSTMAQKRNPIRFEGLEGEWIRTKNEFGKVMDTHISEHQRDLVGSRPARDFPIIIVNLVNQLSMLLRKDKESGTSWLSRIVINKERCQHNFEMSARVILAEPIYIALQMGGYLSDAHELVNRRAVPIALNEKLPLIEVIERLAGEDAEIREALDRIPTEIIELFHHPEQYTGEASQKALHIVDLARTFLKM